MFLFVLRLSIDIWQSIYKIWRDRVVKKLFWKALFIVEHIYLYLIGRIYASNNVDKAKHNAEVRQILIVRLDEIGDMVLTTPFIRELRRGYPKARITLVVKPATYNLFEKCPYIDDLKAFKKSEGRWKTFQNISRAKKFAKKELIGAYDMAIVPRFDGDFAYMAGMIAFFSGAPRRVGYAPWVLPSKARSDRGLERFYTEFVPARPGVCHEVERSLDILRYLGCEIADDRLELWTDDHDETVAEQLLSTGGRHLLGIVLSTGNKHKEWPVADFVAMAKRCRQRGYQPVLLGAGENTRVYGEEFAAACPEAINLIGKCTLRETYAVLRRCERFVGGDTGPMHMATASGVRGCTFYFTNWPVYRDYPVRFGPWKGNIHVLQPKDRTVGIDNNGRISPEDVAEVILG